MPDYGKIKQYLLCFASLGLFLMLVNFVFVVTMDAYPGLLPKQFFGVDFVADNHQKAAAAVAEYRDTKQEAAESLVVLLGLSSASEGIGVGQVATRTGEQTKILSLSGAGRNMREIARYAKPLIARDIQPRLVVFAISSFHLIDALPAGTKLSGDSQTGPSLLERMRTSFLDRRSDVKYAADIGIVDARADMFRFFDVRVDEMGDSPWRENVLMRLNPVKTDRGWKKNLQRYGERGYYEANAFSRSNKQFTILVDLVGEFLDRNSQTLIVLMPEHSSLREQVPNEITARLSKVLQTSFGENAPTVLDHRSVVADVGFTDISHMNKQGREEFSKLLADEIVQRQN